MKKQNRFTVNASPRFCNWLDSEQVRYENVSDQDHAGWEDRQLNLFSPIRQSTFAALAYYHRFSNIIRFYKVSHVVAFLLARFMLTFYLLLRRLMLFPESYVSVRRELEITLSEFLITYRRGSILAAR